jgi:hypothetical protein
MSSRMGRDIEKKKHKATHLPRPRIPHLCTTVVAARFFTLTLAGIVARAIEMTVCTVLAPLGSST